MAQSKWFGIDLMATTTDWNAHSASLSAQIQSPRLLPQFAINGGMGLEKQQYNLTNFNGQSTTRFYNGEVRFFPFGQSYMRFAKKSSKNPYLKKQVKNVGCFTKKNHSIAQKCFKGLYIAPGYSTANMDLIYVPKAELGATIDQFDYNIKDNGATLAAGLQLRFYNLTIGASYGFKVSRPKWSGPIDIVGNAPFTNAFPSKFRFKHGFQLQVGINF
jgi:hypothetical protein